MRRLALALMLATACRRSGANVPTFRVAPEHFSRLVTAEGNLKAVNAQQISAPHEAPGNLKIAWLADDGALVKKDEVIARFDPTEFNNLLLSGNEDHATAQNKIDKNVTVASTTRVNLKRDARQADEELTSAKKFKYDDEQVFSRYQRIESEVDQRLATEKKSHAESVLGVRDQLSQAERDLLSIEDRKAGLEIRNAEQGLHALELRAPYDGLLVLRRDWRGELPRVGSPVWPGTPIGEIPDLSKMNAEVFVLEADAAGLAAGQRATVALESNPGVTYSGKIAQVDKLARPRMRGVPVQYFGVIVALDRTESAVMKPGARVRATLEVENRNGVFPIPRQALFEKDGKKIVYRRRQDRFVPVPVTIGSSTAGRIVVTGIAKGDELALKDPTTSSGQ